MNLRQESVLCLNVIDRHYLYSHLPAEGDTVTLTFDTLSIFKQQCGIASTN